MLAGDFSANTVLLVRLQESVSLMWGAAVGFADALVNTARYTAGSATDLVHHLHSVTAVLVDAANTTSPGAAAS